MECLYDPKCAGFNTDGWLKTATAGTVKQNACDLYVKAAGAPAKTHFLKIDKWDADFEDEPGRPHHPGHDVAKLEALCSKDPACAGFVSAIHSSCFSRSWCLTFARWLSRAELKRNPERDDEQDRRKQLRFVRQAWRRELPDAAGPAAESAAETSEWCPKTGLVSYSASVRTAVPGTS
jgi:hypothetical protein